MDAMTRAGAYGATRVALGVGLALLPAAGAKPWIGDVARHVDVRSPLRVLGVRDALLGAALLRVRDDRRLRPFVAGLCVVADTVDAIVSGADFVRSRRPGAALAAASAAGGALFGLSIAREGR